MRGPLHVLLKARLLSVIGWLVVAAAPLRAQPVTIDGSQPLQVIEGFGVNANHRNWNSNELQPVIDAYIDQDGMSLFRVIFDSTNWEADAYHPLATSSNYFNTLYTDPDFEKLWDLIGYLNQRGITDGIVLNFQGVGPDWMGGTNLTPGLEPEWAERIVSLLLYARNTRHLQFTLLAPNNEPDLADQGVDVTDADQYVLMLHTLAQMLDTNGLGDIRFVAPDLAFGAPAFMPEMMADPVVMAKMAHFSIHSYSPDGEDSNPVSIFLSQSAYSNFTFWVTEYNVWCTDCEAGYYGTYDWTYCRGTAEYLLGHLNNGASAALAWEAYDGYYEGYNHSFWSFWGLFGVDDINATPLTYTARKDFYTVAQVTRFVRPGAQAITVNGSPDYILEAFFHAGSTNLVITGVNTNTDSRTLSGTLLSLPPLSKLEFYYTDSTTNLAHSKTIPVTNGAFTATIPPDCVFTLAGFDPGLNTITNTNRITTIITNPVDGATYTAPATLDIQASATSAGGTVSNVVFFSGTNLLGVAAGAPFNFAWSNVPPGLYTLTAYATNAAGATGISPGVHVTVIGPLAQISVTPSNATVAPLGTQQFSAQGTDGTGNPVIPQPALVWSANGGGSVNSNGLFTSDGTIAGPFAVSATSGAFTGTAAVSINLATAGTGLAWYSLNTPTDDTPQTPAPEINDGDTATDVMLDPGGVDNFNGYEAAGVVWPAPQTISRVIYYNGSYTSDDNGVFAAGFTLQFSPDGNTWTNAGPDWSFSPAYAYNSPQAGGGVFTFTGGPATVVGVRCLGQVHTAPDGINSWFANATEIQSFLDAAALPQPLLLATPATNGISFSWSAPPAVFALQTATNIIPPVLWQPFTNAVQSSGGVQQVTIPPTNQQQFFRLHRQ